MDTWNERLVAAMNFRGAKQGELASVADVSQPAVYKWMRGTTANIGGKEAVAICRFLRVRPEWLFFGTGEMTAIKDSSTQMVDSRRIQTDDGTVTICAHKASSLGNGALMQNDEQIELLNAQEKWASMRFPDATSIENIRIITARDDSMRPTYDRGDALFVDTGIGAIDADGVYAMVLDSRLYIKRVQHVPGAVRLLSDNQKYPPIDIQRGESADLDVIGRVLRTLNCTEI